MSTAKSNYIYNISSDKGKGIAGALSPGSTYKAGDGSTWTKNSDGSISVKTASGNTYGTNYSGGFTNYTGGGNTGGRTGNGGNSNLSAGMVSDDEIGTLKNSTPGATQTPTTPDMTYKSFNDLPTNWNTANVNGAYYKNENGNISQKVGMFNNGDVEWYKVGNGINKDTGEFTLDADTAKKNYLDSMYSFNNKNIDDFDESYLSALQGGTTGQWTNDLIEKIKANPKPKPNRRPYKTVEEIPEEELLLIDDDNSFETDTNDYLKTKLRSFTRGW